MYGEIPPSLATFRIKTSNKITFYAIGLPLLIFGIFIYAQAIWFIVIYSKPEILIVSLPFGSLISFIGVIFILIPRIFKVEINQEKITVFFLFRKPEIYFKDISEISFKENLMSYVVDKNLLIVKKDGSKRKISLAMYSSTDCNEILKIVKQKANI